MHLEGAVDADLLLALAGRNAVPLRWSTPADIQAAYHFTALQDFLDLYYDGCRVLRQERDFLELTRRYLQRARMEGIWHAEMFIGPQSHTLRGVPIEAVMNGVLEAMSEARAQGVGCALLPVVQRHRSEDEALALLQALQPWWGEIAGFGLGGVEVGNPPAKFERFFSRCRAIGFRVVAHAGEEGTAMDVRAALELLGVDRIDHGNACVDDPALVQELAQRRLPLTMCPLSNLRLNVVEALARHPLASLLSQGLCVTVNSDDPAYFGGYLCDNYSACADAFDLSPAALGQLAANSFEAAFMDAQPRQAAQAAVQAHLQAYPTWEGMA